MDEWVDNAYEWGPIGNWCDDVDIGNQLDLSECSDEEWHSDGDEDYAESNDGTDIPDDPYMAGVADALQEFMDLILDKWTSGKPITAIDVCVMCWWLKLAGLGGMVQHVAKRPGQQSGKYKVHLRKKLGIDKLADARLSTLEVPCSEKHTGIRIMHKMPVLNPYEAINLEAANDETLQDTWQQAVDENRLPPMYTDHVVVRNARANGKTAFGCCLYVDGVPTTKRDGIVGFWVYTLLSRKRHLCAVIRKHRLCTCGCKGWCSMWTIFNWLHWNFAAMSAGNHPSTDHLLQTIDDPIRTAVAGALLLYIAALICVKGDWMEYATTFAFSTCLTRPHRVTRVSVLSMTCSTMQTLMA